MRVLFVLENYYPHVGGVENGFRSLCEGLVSHGHSATVLTRKLPGTAQHEVLNGVQIRRVPSGDSRYTFTFAAIPHAIALAREHDVIHTTTYNGAPPAWLAARIARKPVLISVNESWMGKWRYYTNFSPLKAAIHEVLEAAVYALPFDRYVCISESTRRQLLSVRPNIAAKAEVVYYAFDQKPWRHADGPAASIRSLNGIGDRYLVLGYGRPGTSKGFEYLVDAYAMLAEEMPDAALVLILSRATQYRREWEELRRRAHPKVMLLESRPWPEITHWVSAADCVVVPSLTEGFGYTTLEAAAAGRPIVASDTTSIPEVVYGRFVLVPPRDSVAIVRGVQAIRAGGGEQRPPQEFTLSSTLSGYTNAYRRLTAR